MTTDRIDKLLDKVAQRVAEHLMADLSITPDKPEDQNTANVATKVLLFMQAEKISEVLEERLGPLLRAGQAMRETVVGDYGWDAAVAKLEGRE